MDIKLEYRKLKKGDTLLVPHHAGKIGGKTKVAGVGLTGLDVPKTAGQTTITHDRGVQVVIFSLGKKEDLTLDRLRQSGGQMAGWMRERAMGHAFVGLDLVDGFDEEEGCWAVCEGLMLADFAFDTYRSTPNSRPNLKVSLLCEEATATDRQALKRVMEVCRAVNAARALAHEPPNELNPPALAARAKSLAEQVGLGCKIIDEKQMEKMGMGAILAVGKGSSAAPRLIVLEHLPTDKRPPVVLIGKAITFDTGGYSIKTTADIVGMKYDKCGGAAVMGIMQAVAGLQLDYPIVGIITSAENMIAPNAYRPDDIVRTYSGKTVEIVSTDAEGRLVLADALTYAQKHYKPKCMIDMATLTGGVLVALGRNVAGLFCEDDELREALMASSQRTHERLWPLPLYDDYQDLIKSDDADFKNSGGRYAHPVIGGIFLKNFVDKKVPWAHLDIAGTATIDENKAYCPKGATGFGVRLVCDYLFSMSR